MISFFKEHTTSFLLLLATGAFYSFFAYDLDRTDFTWLFTLYAGLFFLSWKLVHLEKFNFRFLLGAAILFRLIFMFSLPNLSQDFYRFIWDGRLLLIHLNPYLYTPKELIASGNMLFSQSLELVNGMGRLSAGNYSNYPPLHQLFFGLAAIISGKSIVGAVVVMRVFIILADIGVFYFGRKLLKKLNLPENKIFWYLLNPFIIIELSGNLHFESIMLFFLVWALYLLHQKKWSWSAVVLACAVSVKLIPLLFLPLLFKKLGIKKAVGYYAVVAAVSFLLFLPFLTPGFVLNYTESIGLWFQKFEFNASVYYLIRWIGFQTHGYNIIGMAGKILPLFVFVFVLVLAFFRRNKTTPALLVNMLFAISVYFFFATTVHSWYLATPLLLSTFTKYKFAFVWSLVVILSYFAYSNPGFQENLWLISLEYTAVFGVLGMEIYKNEISKIK